MEVSQLQSEHEEDTSFEQKFSDNFRKDGHSFYSRIFGQGGHMCAIPQHRLLILSLGLINAVLLLAAVVIGIYCVKAKDIEVAQSVATPLIIEMNHLRNNSDIIRAKMEAQASLVKERSNHQQLKLQLKQKKGTADQFQRQIEALYEERTNLQEKRSSFEQSCGKCLPGWTLLKSSCYYFSAPESLKNWPDSRADCITKGGDLLVINNLEEQQAISDNFPRVMGSSSWWQNGFWMGLTHVETQRTWVWINNVTEVATVYWRHGQPEHNGPQSKDCAAFYFHYDRMKTWYNRNCQDHQHKWICEMQPRQT